MFESILTQYFSGLGVALGKSFVRHTRGVIGACSASTHDIARHVSTITGRDFNTSEKGLSYLLNNAKFQIDDTYWRRHMAMVFDLMTEQSLIKKGDQIALQVDFTTHENYFLILTASIIIENRTVPLYFTMRNYPKTRGCYDHKRMEMAFLKGLRHILSKKYTYIIVADRGFSNERFMRLCDDNGFDFMIRTTPNLTVKHGQKKGIMEHICQHDGAYAVEIVSWKKALTLFTKQQRHRCMTFLLTG